MDNLRQAKVMFDKMSNIAKKLHQEYWNRIQSEVVSSIPKPSKVFEVHHLVDYFRNIYCEFVIDGLAADDCYTQTIMKLKGN